MQGTITIVLNFKKAILNAFTKQHSSIYAQLQWTEIVNFLLLANTKYKTRGCTKLITTIKNGNHSKREDINPLKPEVHKSQAPRCRGD